MLRMGDIARGYVVERSLVMRLSELSGEQRTETQVAGLGEGIEC